MFLFRLVFTLLWTFMTMLVAFIVYAVLVYNFDPIVLAVLAPYGTLAILTFWIKDIQMKLFVVIAYDTEGKPYVYADYADIIDANVCALEIANAVVRTVEI